MPAVWLFLTSINTATSRLIPSPLCSHYYLTTSSLHPNIITPASCQSHWLLGEATGRWLVYAYLMHLLCIPYASDTWLPYNN